MADLFSTVPFTDEELEVIKRDVSFRIGPSTSYPIEDENMRKNILRKIHFQLVTSKDPKTKKPKRIQGYKMTEGIMEVDKV